MLNLHIIAVRTERLIYRISALPIALAVAYGRPQGDAAGALRQAFAWRYWRPDDAADWLELGAGLLLTPIVVALAILWFTARNGPTIRKRSHKGMAAQMREQLDLYFKAGILAPWYYIFSLYRDGDVQRARSFLQRSETKWGVFYLLRVPNASPLSDKKIFADLCAAHGVRCVPYVLCLDGTPTEKGVSLPDSDLFVKPVNGRGGKGAERWDRIDRLTYSMDGVGTFNERSLIERLQSKARWTPLLVQRRFEPHSEIADLTSGALPTIRVLTCLNEHGAPEVMAAVFRMSIGSNRTVDNIHAGGLACGVSVDEGVLGPASNLGMDARLGWHSTHPTTGARIEGRRLPQWDEVKALAVQAHAAFADRPLVGWDIAILPDSPTVVEGNGSPDMDLMQRFMERGFCEHRFAELLTHHLKARGFVN